MLVDEFLQDTWSGTATELCDALKTLDSEADLAPRTITKRLKSNMGLFKENNIAIVVDRNRDSRLITITRQGEQEQTERDVVRTVLYTYPFRIFIFFPVGMYVKSNVTTSQCHGTGRQGLKTFAAILF